MRPRQARTAATPRWIELAVFLLVSLVSLKATHGLLGTFDVGLDDESVYLDGARYLGIHSLPIAESSPLYPMWYRLLSVFEPDRLHLYFTNWYLLTAGLPIVLYALARRSGAPLASAAAIAVAWSVSGAGMTWPFVTKFAALLIAIGALAATFARNSALEAAAVGSVTLSLASYARAELTMFAFGLTAVVVLWAVGSVATARTGRWRGLTFAAIALAVAALLRLRFGDTGTGNRAYFAFAQHYALNVIEDQHLPIDPWTNWYTFATKAFPTATTVGGALKENPSAFVWHVTRNVTTLPNTLTELFRPLRYVPVPIRNVVTLAFDAALASGILGFVFFRSRRPGRVRRWLLLLGLVAASAALSILVVYPREHYVLPMCFLGTAAAAAGGGRISERLSRSFALRRATQVARVLLIFALGLYLAAVPTFRTGAAPSLARAAIPEPGPWARENVLTIEELRRLHLVGRVVILESDYSRALYTDYDYVRVPQWEKSAPFWEFVHARGIGVVVLNDRLRDDTRFKDDLEFRRFVDREEPLEDFVFVPVENTRAVIAIRRTLLPH
jgi:hypothetical protein